MKSLHAVGFFFLAFFAILAAPVAGSLHARVLANNLTGETTAFLHRYVDKNGKVDYSAIRRDSEQLDALLFSIGGFDVAHATPADQYAFYLNAYNVLVIGDIVRNYPLKSVQDMPGFFNKTLHRVGREQLTLDQIETDKLRRIYDDPRLHFALVCGTQSCPPLSQTAYVGSRLPEQLNSQARFALADPNYVQVDPTTRQVRLPQIFKWYEADFTSSGRSEVLYVNQFRPDKAKSVPTGYAVDYYPYDWRLNDQAAR
ncbi:MAG: DUF547 domain-containing protein [Bacteroidota bacterium]|nr:DUF547 domain-containing protein [Bacteroidota bacterium]